MQVYYVVDKPTSWFWKGGKGHITADTVKQQLPPPSDKNLILVRSPRSAPAPPVNGFAPPAYAGVASEMTSQEHMARTGFSAQ